MHVLLELDCPNCEKMVIVDEDDVVDQSLYCPHCGTVIPVPGLSEEQDEQGHGHLAGFLPSSVNEEWPLLVYGTRVGSSSCLIALTATVGRYGFIPSFAPSYSVLSNPHHIPTSTLRRTSHD